MPSIQSDIQKIFRSSNTARGKILKDIDEISQNLNDNQLTKTQKDELQIKILYKLLKLNKNSRNTCKRLVNKIESNCFSL